MDNERTPRVNPGEWLTQRQRLGLTDRRPPPPDRTAEVADLIPALLKTIRLDDRLWQNRIFEEWVAIVGEPVARHARPGEVFRGTLSIYVDHSIWLAELTRTHKTRLLQNIQARIGADRIRAIRLQLDPDLEKNREPPRRGPRPPRPS